MAMTSSLFFVACYVGEVDCDWNLLKKCYYCTNVVEVLVLEFYLTFLNTFYCAFVIAAEYDATALNII